MNSITEVPTQAAPGSVLDAERQTHARNDACAVARFESCFDALETGLAACESSFSQPIEHFINDLLEIDDWGDSGQAGRLFSEGADTAELRRALVNCHVASFVEGRHYFAAVPNTFPVDIGQQCLHVLQHLNPTSRLALLTPASDATKGAIVRLNYDGTVIVRLPGSRWLLPLMPECVSDTAGALTRHEMQGLLQCRLDNGLTVAQTIESSRAELTLDDWRMLAHWHAFKGQKYASADRHDLSASEFVSACEAAMCGDEWGGAVLYCEEALRGLKACADASLAMPLGSRLKRAFDARGFTLSGAEVAWALAERVLDPLGLTQSAACHRQQATQCFEAAGLTDPTGNDRQQTAGVIREVLSGHKAAFSASGLTLASYDIRFDDMEDRWTRDRFDPDHNVEWCLMRSLPSGTDQQGVLDFVTARTVNRFYASVGQKADRLHPLTHETLSKRDFYVGRLMLDILNVAKRDTKVVVQPAIWRNAALQQFMDDNLSSLHACVDRLDEKLLSGALPEDACEAFVADVTRVGGWGGLKPLLAGNFQVGDFRVALAECFLASFPVGQAYLVNGGRNFPIASHFRARTSSPGLMHRLVGGPDFPVVTGERSLRLLQSLTPEARAAMLIQTQDAARTAPKSTFAFAYGLISLTIPGTRWRFALMPSCIGGVEAGVTAEELERLQQTFVAPGETIRQSIANASGRAGPEDLRSMADWAWVLGGRYAAAGRHEYAVDEFRNGCEAALRADAWGAAAINCHAALDSLRAFGSIDAAQAVGTQLIKMFEDRRLRLFAAAIRCRLADQIFDVWNRQETAEAMRSVAREICQARGVTTDVLVAGDRLNYEIRAEIGAWCTLLQSGDLKLHRSSIRFDNMQDRYLCNDFDPRENRAWGLFVRTERESGRDAIFDVVSCEAVELLQSHGRQLHPTMYRGLRADDFIEGVLVLDILQAAGEMSVAQVTVPSADTPADKAKPRQRR
ncbi:hypothetical protein [Pandoraea commovens]|uniref:Uncharacterized protein n=1 Tax=Pandoraea commovens TaxID=2508289 RepID=A0A5E4YVD6_9BURK|nr:hypothetical protein [Pandoraea commovens]VVE52110.1 hypothetical protein PCO31010_04766 [Pandoraea commovens]